MPLNQFWVVHFVGKILGNLQIWAKLHKSKPKNPIKIDKLKPIIKLLNPIKEIFHFFPLFPLLKSGLNKKEIPLTTSSHNIIRKIQRKSKNKEAALADNL